VKGVNLQRGKTSSNPPCTVYLQSGACGAVFRDIGCKTYRWK